jgi:hypothetical protein
VTDRNFSTENQENVVDLDARRAVPASDGKLTPEVFENPGAVVDETVAPVTATTSFGQNVRTKAFFESAIDASWQKSTQGIFDTGRWLQRAREELSRNDYDALRLPFCVRTRQRLIAIAAHPILATHVSQLPPSWGTLYALAEINNYNLLRAPLAERAGSMPRQGVASAFKYGRAAGTIEAVIACCGIPMMMVEPSKWKRAFHLNSDKETSRQLAIGLFPHAHDQLNLRRHHQRAEAMLIALFTANNRAMP